LILIPLNHIFEEYFQKNFFKFFFQFGYVSQHPFLFSGTLFDNLSIANTSLNNTQIEACISERGLSQWLEQFGGLNKIICEGGNNLSFGERQLISLLRLSLTRPKVWKNFFGVFDLSIGCTQY